MVLVEVHIGGLGSALAPNTTEWASLGGGSGLVDWVALIEV